MRNTFLGFSKASIDDDRRARPAILQPLAIDPWVASSLLQKAIRRCDADLEHGDFRQKHILNF
jgi:hypothetical protein